jgi:hypothetical protein
MRAHLFFVIDALGWSVAERAGFLEGFAAVRSPAAPVLGYSCACIPSLLTGRLPREHGRWGMYRRDPARSPFRRYRWLLRAAERARHEGFVRRYVKRRLDAGGRYRGYFQLYSIPLGRLEQFDIPETEDLFLPGGVPGHATILDLLARRAGPLRSWSWRTPEDENFREMAAAIGEKRWGSLLLYAPDLDARLHASGTASPRVSERLAWYDERIREMAEAARRAYGDVVVVVMSDHGMTDTVGAHDLWSEIRALGLEEPGEVLYFLDSTMARFWFGTERARRAVGALLARQKYGHVLTPEEERAFGVDFPAREYGETAFLLDPGHLIVPSYMGERAPAGMHGFDPDHPQSVGFFASSVPVSGPPRSILNVFGVVDREILP